MHKFKSNVYTEIKGFLKYNTDIYQYRWYSHLRILFFGNDDFSLPSLKLISNINESFASKLEVVTSYKTKRNHVKEFAEKNKITVHNYAEIKKNPEICTSFDLGVVVSFGHLIPEKIINNFKFGLLNVHASLLPKYRGASPIIYAIKNHENITGVSIMKIAPGNFDVGDVLAQKKILISDDVLMPELHDKLSKEGAELLVEVIRNLENIKAIKQDDKLASYAPKINNEFCKVRWSEMTALQVYDLYRALYSIKSLLTSFKGDQIRLYDLSRNLDLTESNHLAGHIKFSWKTKKILIGCSDGKAIEVGKLTKNKKVMNAIDFYNGYLSKIKHNDEKKFE